MFFKHGIIVLLLALIADQGNKYHLVGYFAENPDSITVTSFFNLVMVWNPGISFGMFGNIANGQIIFACIALTITIILLFWLKNADKRIVATALGLICGGALGNTIDRVRFGAVADFYDFHLASYHWPAFNIADVAVFIGAVIICMDSLFCSEKKLPNEENNELENNNEAP